MDDHSTPTYEKQQQKYMMNEENLRNQDVQRLTNCGQEIVNMALNNMMIAAYSTQLFNHITVTDNNGQ